jgi:tetratricopeptide (TPR) repeat protein
MPGVDITLVKHFNLAVQLARDGEHAASLSAYRMILAKAAAGAKASDEFCGTAWMRVGFCLMDLGRYEEAKTEFETMKPLLAALSKEAQYEFHFAYGNTLGKLGALDAMYSELISAVCLAEDMEDYCSRPASCWARSPASPKQVADLRLAVRTLRSLRSHDRRSRGPRPPSQSMLRVTHRRRPRALSI